ncbi:MAG TPA: TonB-dependent receptor [Bryobacteraceae bacterium]
MDEGFPDPRLGKKQLGMFVQDTWKVTRKFTLDYGLRYDYSTYLKESQGRAPGFSFTAIQPLAGIPGASIYDGYGAHRCNCNFASNYPYAAGPRLGAAYQFAPKTVLGAGFGIVYNGTGQNNQAANEVANAAGGSTATFGNDITTLSGGYPAQFDPLQWPTYNPAFFPISFPTPNAAPTDYDRNAGGPARQYQWSIGLQREILPNLSIEAAYVGNRGIWWHPGTGELQCHLVSAFGGVRAQHQQPSRPSAADIPVKFSARDRSRIRQPTLPWLPVVPDRIPILDAVPAVHQYPGRVGPSGQDLVRFATSETDQAPISWFVCRGNFTWQKNLIMGAEREPNFATAASGSVHDVFNRPINKYISEFDQPRLLLIDASYITPRIGGNEALSWLAGDWTFGVFLAYRSGLPLEVPNAQTSPSMANLVGQPTFADRVPGVPLFTVDLNCHCYDPRNVYVLNAKAWVGPPPGQFGTATAYYSDYREHRRPSENADFGRTFRIKERVTLNIRAEFTDIFNRAFIPDPGTGATTVGGAPTILNLTNATATVYVRNPNGTTAKERS